MNREQIIYNNIMTDIKTIKQKQPLFYRLSVFLKSYISSFENLFSLTDKLALVAIALVFFSANQLYTANNYYTDSNLSAEESFYTLAYQTDLNLNINNNE